MISWPPKEHTNDKAHKRLIVDAVHWVLQWFNGLQDSTNNQALVSDGSGSLAFKEVVTTEGGQTINGNTSFIDNAKALFGTGLDLEIYHNGSNAFIENNTGQFVIDTPSGFVFRLSGTNELILNTGNLAPLVTGGLALGSQTLGFSTLYLQERSVDAGHSAGTGQIWVKNDTPCTLYFTDDAGTDHQLGVGIQYPDAITGHIKAGNTQIPDGDTTTTDLNVTSSLASATWESIGPTGSGADNIWAQLDDLPESAAILIVDVSISMIPTSTTSPAVISLYATSGGVASPTADTHKNRVISSVFDVNASTTVQSANTQRVLIPLHTDQTFKMYWATSNVTGSVFLYYRGFMSD